MPAACQSRIQPGAPLYEAGPEHHHHGEAFFSLALSRSPLDQVPHRPLLISPLANENERPEHASYVSGYFEACSHELLRHP
jgi:hypothetical protein